MRSNFARLLVASTLALGVSVPAHAASFLFGLTGSSNLSGTYGNSRLFSATSGGTTVNVRATAWSVSSNLVRNAYLGAYGNGLGVTSRAEGSGGNNTHTTDNQSGTDFIIFQFDKPVEFISGKFTTYRLGSLNYQDSDATIDYGTTATAWNSPLSLDNTNISVVNALLNGAGYEATGGSASTGDLRDLQPGAPGGKVGNIWMVASSFVNQDGKKDAFKFSQLTVSYMDPLPEPESWAMMLAGFGFAGAAMRRTRKTRATA